MHAEQDTGSGEADSPIGPADPVVLLENSKDANGRSLLFEGPRRIITCEAPDEIEAAFEKLEAALEEGLSLAGFFSYELGYVLEPRLRPLLPRNRRLPLLWFAAFDRPQRLSRRELEAYWRDQAQARQGCLVEPEDLVDERTYKDAIRRIHGYLTAGDVYQINYTYERLARLEGDPRALHAALRAAQPVGFGAYIGAPDFVISSHSPELFFRKSGDTLTSRPMKGTAPRGPDMEEDDAQAAWLRHDEKSRAENLMIVDLLRNDLSRLARPGSVRATPLYEVERYLSVLQMTSTVSGQLRGDTRLRDILEAIFPCGSVTGAPKIRAMEIIRELEGGPRGAYTGAIGYITPAREACFSVPIRTLAIGRDRRARFGIGSGIVADSIAEDEYNECALKARFLDAAAPTSDTQPPPGQRPALIETIKWSAEDGFWLWPEHRARLAASATWFGYPIDLAETDSLMQQLGEILGAKARALPDEPHLALRRVRLLAGPGGEISVTATALERQPTLPVKLALARTRLEAGDPYLRHKTTRRSLYNQALKVAREKGCWDKLFLNGKGEVAEGARSTLFIESGGRLLTPPLSAGALPGVFRTHLLADSRTRIEEKTLTLADLEQADHIFVGNALYGFVEVEPELERLEF